MAISVPIKAIIITVNTESDVAPSPTGRTLDKIKYATKAASVPEIPPVIPLRSLSKNNVKVNGLFSVMASSELHVSNETRAKRPSVMRMNHDESVKL